MLTTPLYSASFDGRAHVRWCGTLGGRKVSAMARSDKRHTSTQVPTRSAWLSDIEYLVQCMAGCILLLARILLVNQSSLGIAKTIWYTPFVGWCIPTAHESTPFELLAWAACLVIVELVLTIVDGAKWTDLVLVVLCLLVFKRSWTESTSPKRIR